MKRLIVILLAAALLLTACVPPDDSNGEMSEVSSAESSLSKASETLINAPLQGNSLEEMGITIHLGGIDVDDPSIDYKLESQTEAIEGGERGKLGKYNSFIGNCTYICVLTSDESNIECDYIPIMILQGFYKSDFEGGRHISIGGTSFTYRNLADCVWYEDDEKVVYDIRGLMSDFDLKKYLYEYGENSSKYTWMDEIYQILCERNTYGRLFNYAVPNDIVLNSDYRMCEVSDEASLEKIGIYLNGLNAFKFFDMYPPTEKGFDLSEQTVIRALYYSKTADTDEIRRWHAENLLPDNFPYGNFIEKESFENFVKDSFCEDTENIDLTGLNEYYIPSLKHYGVPIWDNYTGQVRVLKSFEEQGDKIKLEYTFLYYDGLTMDSEKLLTAINSSEVLGVINSEGAMLDRGKFEAVPTYEFTFCRDGDKIKLHSIYKK